MMSVPAIKKVYNFTDFTLLPPKPSEDNKMADGRQKKGAKTGRYVENATGRANYIKSSEKYFADTIAEVVASRLLEFCITREHAVPYKFVISETEGVYVASEIREGFEQLKDRVGTLPKAHFVFSEPLTATTKKNIGDVLEGQERAMGRILAGCLLLRDYDCQVGNVCFYLKTVGEESIAKFDNGWSLSGICKDENARIDLFQIRSPVSQAATHPLGFVPTNHFNDYLLIKEKGFIEDLMYVAGASINIAGVVKEALDEVEEAYEKDPKNGSKYALLKFAEHIGLKTKYNSKQFEQFSNMEIHEIKKQISSELTKALIKRRDSMKLLSSFLKIKFALSNESQEILTKEKIIELITEVKAILLRVFFKEKNYDQNQSLEDIFPSFEPSPSILFKKLARIAQAKGVDPENVSVCARLARSGTLKSLKEYLPDNRDLISLKHLMHYSLNPVSTVIQSTGAVNEKDKDIIRKVVNTHKMEGYSYQEHKGASGFSVTGPDPIAIISEAQEQGASLLSYTLSAATTAHALRIIKANQKTLSTKGEKYFVHLSRIQITGKKTYHSVDEFMREYEKSAKKVEEPDNKKVPKETNPKRTQ